MLDCFEILTTSGVVLWSKSYAPVGPNVINSLIRDVFIEENALPGSTTGTDVSARRNPPYKNEKYTLRWTTAKDLGLIFVAVYQSLLHLSWIDNLLDNVKTLFTSLYREQFKKAHTSVVDCQFDDYFERQLEELERNAGGATSADSTPTTELTPPSSAGAEEEQNGTESPPGARMARRAKAAAAAAAVQTFDDTTSTEVTPIPTPDGSRPSTPSSHILSGKPGQGGRTSRRARKAAATTSASRDLSASSLNKPGSAKSMGKKMRRWDDNGIMDEDSDVVLDYSRAAGDGKGAETDGPAMSSNNTSNMPAPGETFGKKTGEGEVVLRDLDEEMDSILSSAAAAASSSSKLETASGGIVNSGLGAISGLFRNVVGGKKLSAEDIAKPLKGMEEHLVKKNVARDAAVRLCDAVSRDLIDTKTGSFQSIDASIQASMERALTKMLTPSTSLDLLRSIQGLRGSRPYVISVVGVNGVGKSTTLAKLAYLLLHNKHRVLVCGADTFRSGAVEQLRVHVHNLQSLISSSSNGTGESDTLGQIDLYERGYGKDPAHIARDAVAHATSTGLFDVVLIDTAGRRHNDTRLMSSLEAFARLAQPDKIFMVGEALVGTDSVAQARHFNSSFGPNRHLDGFIVSKCDTVGEMVGTLVSLVFATNIPVIALGVGQHYGDLRSLNVKWAMKLLMQ